MPLTIRAEFDTASADAKAKQLNATMGEIGKTARVSGDSAAAGFDKVTAAALRSQKTLDILGPDLVQIGKVGSDGVGVLASRMDAMTASLKASAQAVQEAKRAGGGDTPRAPKSPSALAEEYGRIEDKNAKDAARQLDALIAAQQAKELSGLQKIEAQRQGTLAKLNETAELEKKINSYYDQRAAKFNADEQAAAIKKAGEEKDRQAARELAAHDKISKLQQGELSGAQKLEAQRQQALKSLGLTEDHVKKINLHFDQLASKAGNQALASNIKNFIQNPMGAAAEAAEGLITTIGSVGIAVAAGIAIFAAVAVAVKDMADSQFLAVDALQDMSAATGLTTGQVQILNKQAEIGHDSVGGLAQAVRRMNEDFATGGAASAKVGAALAALGVQAHLTADGVTDVYRAFDEAMKKLEEIEDPARRGLLAGNLFGTRSSTELKKIVAEYEATKAIAEQIVVVIDGPTQEAANKYHSNLVRIKSEWEAQWLKIKTLSTTVALIASEYALKMIEAQHAAEAMVRALLRLPPPKPKDDAAETARQVAKQEAARDQNVKTRDDFLANGGRELQDQRIKAETTKLERIRQDITLAHEEAGSANPDTAKSGIFNLYRLGREAKEQEDRLTAMKFAAGAEKAALEEVTAAQKALTAAREKDAGGQRAIELRNAEQLRQRQTRRDDQGKEIFTPNAQVQALGAEELGVERAGERRRQDRETAQLKRKADDEATTAEIDNVRRVGKVELDSLRLREATGTENLRTIEAARLESTKRTIAQVEQLELARIRRQTAAEVNQFNIKAVNDLSQDPSVRAQQIEDLAANQKRIQAEGAARAAKVSSDAKGSADDATAALGATQTQRGREEEKAVAQARFDDATAELEHRRNTIRQAEEAELDSLALVQAHTLSSRLALEQARLQVHLKALRQEETLDLELSRRQQDHEIEVARKTALERGTDAQHEAAIEREINERGVQQRVRIELDAIAQIDAARRASAIKAAQDVIDAQRQVYDELKKQTESILDIMFGNSKHKGQDILEEIKKTAIKAAKDVISTQIAIIATSAATGKPVGQQTNTAGTGLAGILQRILGVKPVFSGLTPEQKANAAAIGAATGKATKDALASLKLEQPGSVGDVQLDHGSVPVSITGGSGAPGGGSGDILSGRGGQGRGEAFPAQTPPDYGPIIQAIRALKSEQNAVPVFVVNQCCGSGQQEESKQREHSAKYKEILGQLRAITPPPGEGGGSYPQQIPAGVASTNITYDGGVGDNTNTGPGTVYQSSTYEPTSGGGGGFARVAGIGGSLLSMALGGMIPGGGAGAGAAAEGIGSGGGAAGLSRLPDGLINRTGSAAIEGSGSTSQGLPQGIWESISPMKGGTGATVPGGGGTAGGVAGAAKTGLGGIWQSLKSSAGFGTGPNSYGSPGVGTGLSGGLKAVGKSDIAAAAGTALAMDGIRRGGFKGGLETTAGGALIGYRYGGPVGAAVGAVVGAAVGTARYFWHTKAEETVARVKEKYGLRINADTAQQIAETAKSKYGGSIDAALQSGDVQQLLSLYSQQTGGNYGSVGPVAGTLGYNGAGLQQAGTYQNGKLLGFDSSVSAMSKFDGKLSNPTFDRFGQDPTKITLSLDGESSSAFLQGQTVAAIGNNPAAVSSANLAANTSSTNRLSQLAALTSPSTVIA